MTGPSGRGPTTSVRALGVDLGSKRIGIAVSDISGTVASALTTVHRSKSSPPRSRSRSPEVGPRRGVRGGRRGPAAVARRVGHGPAAKRATTEAKQMASVVGVPVEMYDERFTTVTAERGMLEAGLDAKSAAPGRRQGRGRGDVAGVARPSSEHVERVTRLMVTRARPPPPRSRDRSSTSKPALDWPHRSRGTTPTGRGASSGSAGRRARSSGSSIR